MNLIVQNQKKAIEMRREGSSYFDISKALKVSKTSVSNWVKNVRLTESEKNHLEKTLTIKMQRARMKASITNRSRKIFKEKKAYEDAEREFKKLTRDPLFMAGIGLYWAKGTLGQGSIQFASSDPQMITIILAWIEKYLLIQRNTLNYRLFIDFSEKNKEIESYWAKTVGISVDKFGKTIYKETNKKRKKPNDYKGSLSFSIGSIRALRMVIAWQKLFIRYYS